MNLMRSAEEWLKKQRDQFVTDLVTYRHFGESPETLQDVPVTRGRTLFRAETDYGITVRTYSTDFLIDTEHLTFLPEKGDEIICGKKRFEVLAPNNEPVWRYSGFTETTLRIHAKEIDNGEND